MASAYSFNVGYGNETGSNELVRDRNELVRDRFVWDSLIRERV
jgi:hypothetical protein